MRPAILVVVSLAGLEFARAWQLRAAQEELQQANALQLANAGARTLDGTIAVTQALLVSLSELVDPKAPAAENDQVLRRIHSAAPVPYANLWITDSLGNSLGTAVHGGPGQEIANVADRPYFKEVIATKRFTVGAVVRSRLLPGAPRILTFTMPVLDSLDANVEAVVGATIVVDSLELVRMAKSLPDGSVLTISDTNATVIFRTLDPDHWIGRSFKGDTGMLTDRSVGQRVGSRKLSADGTVRMVGARAMQYAPWVVYVGIPARFTVDVARNQFLRDALIGSLFALVLFLIAYRATLRVVIPIESLTADAQAIAAGDMARRSTVEANDEVGDLARAFNSMADTVVQRTQALEASQVQLLHAQKMEALGSFAGGIAHDFNNHLHAIIGHAELASRNLPESSAIRADLTEVIASAARAADLTRQILVFSRKQLVHPQLLDLNDVVRGIERMLLRVAREDRHLDFVYAPERVPVVADHGQLEQVIVNLVANARDATSAGGMLVVSVARTSDHATNAGHGELRVSDNGVGMEPQTVERIFDPFFSTKGRTEGTGLGLAMAHGIVTQAGGAILVDSSPGVGTTFTVRLPLGSGVPAPNGTHAMPRAELPVGRGRILLADDDEAVRETTSRMLQSAGYTVVSAADGPAALLQFQSSREPFDLLLTDVVMPRMTGSELATQIRAKDQAIGVLLMSGYADDERLQEMLAAGSVACIPKPFSVQTLVEMVAETLAARQVSTR